MNTNLIKPELPLLRRLGRDLDWFFDRFGFERPFPETGEPFWVPDLEIFERGNELVVRADVPGMKREEISVEITDAELTIKGERRKEKEENENGYYRAERSYGTFYRTVTLPEGVKAELAMAVVKDGVLEVKMPIAKIEPTRRKLEITEGPAEVKGVKHAA
jgi:HSP20 family protein